MLPFSMARSVLKKDRSKNRSVKLQHGQYKINITYSFHLTVFFLPSDKCPTKDTSISD